MASPPQSPRSTLRSGSSPKRCRQASSNSSSASETSPGMDCVTRIGSMGQSANDAQLGDHTTSSLGRRLASVSVSDPEQLRATNGTCSHLFLNKFIHDVSLSRNSCAAAENVDAADLPREMASDQSTSAISDDDDRESIRGPPQPRRVTVQNSGLLKFIFGEFAQSKKPTVTIRREHNIERTKALACLWYQYSLERPRGKGNYGKITLISSEELPSSELMQSSMNKPFPDHSAFYFCIIRDINDESTLAYGVSPLFFYGIDDTYRLETWPSDETAAKYLRELSKAPPSRTHAKIVRDRKAVRSIGGEATSSDVGADAPKGDRPRLSRSTPEPHSRSASDSMTDKSFAQVVGKHLRWNKFSGSSAHRFCEAFAVPKRDEITIPDDKIAYLELMKGATPRDKAQHLSARIREIAHRLYATRLNGFGLSVKKQGSGLGSMDCAYTVDEYDTGAVKVFGIIEVKSKQNEYEGGLVQLASYVSASVNDYYVQTSSRRDLDNYSWPILAILFHPASTQGSSGKIDVYAALEGRILGEDPIYSAEFGENYSGDTLAFRKGLSTVALMLVKMMAIAENSSTTFRDVKWTTKDKKEIVYKHKERLSPFVYSGDVPKGPSSPVVLKHSNRYGKKAHKCAAQHGIAPKLIMSKKRGNGHRIIIMEKVEGQHPLQVAAKMTHQQRETLLDAIDGAVIQLHAGGYVHGDLRNDNIIVNCDSSPPLVRLIDFEFAGVEGEVKYGNTNPEITFPKEDSDLVTRTHDYYFLAGLKSSVISWHWQERFYDSDWSDWSEDE